MRILLIAYEFPPSASPQSLRWAYLARELSFAGHEMHVLTIDLGGTTAGLPELPPTVKVHRSHAGPVRGLVARRRRQRQLRDKQGHDALPADGNISTAMFRTALKQLASERLQRLAEHVWFPDLRGEWLQSGQRALTRLLHKLNPDVVISSHEPATTLQLGLQAEQAGFRWIADLGDPVLAPYTPSKWRRRAFALEGEVCRRAEHILVTADSARVLLAERHGRHDKVELFTQGFDDRAGNDLPTGSGLFDPDRLELLYTGSFYSFRNADALIEAVRQHPSVRLNIASVVAPSNIIKASRRHPENFRLLGFLPHAVVLQLQREVDVLVNIANNDATQVPGKLYEYLGACRPILHLRNGRTDAPAAIIDRLQRGHVCDNDPVEIGERLVRLADAKRHRTLDDGFRLDRDSVAQFGWSRIGQRLDRLVVETR